MSPVLAGGFFTTEPLGKSLFLPFFDIGISNKIYKYWAGGRTSWNQDCQEKYQYQYADDTTLMAESEEELKSLLVKIKEKIKKVGLKLNIQKTKIMASGPITLWQIDGETVETVTDFIFLGSKITADSDCSHEIKGHLLLGRKVMTNLDSILKAETLLCQQSSV